MRRAAALAIATLGASVLLAACGSSSTNLIPSNNAATIGADLSSLSSALDVHSCTNTQTALGSLLTDINNLPSSVATKLRNNLLAGYEELDNTARTQCRPPAGSHTHPHTNSSGPSGLTTSPSGTTTGTGGTTTGSGGTTTGTGGTTTGSGGTTTGSSGTIGPGGGTGAPPGSTGDSGTGTGGAASGQ